VGKKQDHAPLIKGNSLRDQKGYCLFLQKPSLARHWWFIPVILVTWEAEIERITV
jgi:hypothetical protein